MVYGERWQSALARASGLSQGLLSLIASDDRKMTPAAKAANVKAIAADAKLTAKQAARAIAMLDGIE